MDLFAPLLILDITLAYSNEITHVYICIKLYVYMCMKLEKTKIPLKFERTQRYQKTLKKPQDLFIF
jgi:uncharacterized ferritin-like protein (DUF455 family)